MSKVISLFVFFLAVAVITPALASKKGELDIIGKVYCDTCRVQFQTELSKGIEGASVELICRDAVSQEKRYEKVVRTQKDGSYTIHVDGDHTDDLCDVALKESSDENCKEASPDLNKVQVDLALNDGIHQTLRYVNPLGFMANKALPGCKKLLDDMGLAPSDN